MTAEQQTETPGGASDVDQRVKHLLEGGTLSSNAQSIYKVRDDEFFLCCDSPGCCDTSMTLTEVEGYILSNAVDEWECVPDNGT